MATKTKAEVELENKELAEQLSKKDKTINSLNEKIDKFDEMFKKMEDKMNKLSSIPKETKSNVDINETIYIGHTDLKRMYLVTNKRETQIKTDKCSPFSIEDAREVVRNSKYRELIDKGVIYFEDKKWYKYFRIENNVLTDEKIMKIVSKEKSQMYSELNALIGKDFVVKNMLLYRIAKLFKSGKQTQQAAMNHGDLEIYFDNHLGLAMNELEYIEGQF